MDVIQRYYANKIAECDLLDAIDNAVEEWHLMDTNLCLYKYLGMCSYEYSLWVKDPELFLAQIHEQKYCPKKPHCDDGND